MVPVVAEALFDLQGEFAGGGEDQGADAAALAQIQSIQDGQRESGGLARTGFGRRDDVVALERGRNGGELDGSGFGVALLVNGAQKGLAQSQVGKKEIRHMPLVSVIRDLQLLELGLNSGKSGAERHGGNRGRSCGAPPWSVSNYN